MLHTVDKKSFVLIFNIQTLFNMLITDEPSISLLVMCHLTVLLEQGLAEITTKNQIFFMGGNYQYT